MSIFTYGIRVKRVLFKHGATAEFTRSEVVSAIVNLMDARRYLSREEYIFVEAVFDIYRADKQKILLDKNGFLDLCNEIITHLDLIAPYYKICGDPGMRILSLDEKDKIRYRKRAWELIGREAFFGDEWMELHSEFANKFAIED